MGQRARVRIAQRFSVEAMVASTERLYDDLVWRAARARRRGPAWGRDRPRRVPVPALRGHVSAPRDHDAGRARLPVPDPLAPRLRWEDHPRRGEAVHRRHRVHAVRPVLALCGAPMSLPRPDAQALPRHAAPPPRPTSALAARFPPHPRCVPEDGVLRPARARRGHCPHPRQLGVASCHRGVRHLAADRRVVELHRSRLGHLRRQCAAGRENPRRELRGDLHRPQQGVPHRRQRARAPPTRSPSAITVSTSRDSASAAAGGRSVPHPDRRHVARMQGSARPDRGESDAPRTRRRFRVHHRGRRRGTPASWSGSSATGGSPTGSGSPAS